MVRPSSSKSNFSHWFTPSVLLAILLLAAHLILLPVSAAELGPRVLQLQDNEAGDTTDYQLNFDTSTSGQLGEITIQFCANTPILDDVCIVPVGLDVSQAVLTDQDGPGDFAIDTGQTVANELVLTRTPDIVAAGNIRFNFTTITNPSNPGSYYARISTIADSVVGTPISDYGGIAFAITNQISVTATVPPYLIFCTGTTITGLNCANALGDFIDFGQLSQNHVSNGSSQMLAATNAEGGYNITVHGTTMTSGVHAITALATNDVSRPGTAQFGLNLRANSTPADGNDPTGPGTSLPQPDYNIPNTYRFNDGDTLVNALAPDDVRLYTASYIVNVPAGQAPGIYVSTLTYICLADF